MDEKSLNILEFPKVRESLAGFAAFSASRDIALGIEPSSDPDLVRQMLRESAESRHLLSMDPFFTIGGAHDVREAAKMAARGKVLEPQTLIEIQATAAAARRVRTGLEKCRTELPALWQIAQGILELPDLEEEIGRCLSATGEVLDSASAELVRLRNRLKEARQQLLNRLETLMKSPRSRRFVQEAFITEREGRYVIPVKAEFRKEIKGIVHDVSDSGATVLIEPWTTIDLGNELRQITAAERQEVERILTALSAQVGAGEEALSSDVALVAEIDLALAKARYAQETRAAEPTIASGGSTGAVLSLLEARHPLLGGKAVPLSVEIGRDFSVLIITGPNTGGKTVALKTLGLLTLMAQAGIPIPASSKSSLPIYDSIFADIGDEQSIEQTLSTFSWHMGNIARIMNLSTARSLVLLDELGTSTDPSEGAALARAILAHFQSRGSMAVATTHYGELKAFAHATPRMQNASLDFDPETLEPTYHLTVGIPGGSNALTIASKLGLSPEVVAAARGMLGRTTQDIDGLLGDLMREKQKVQGLLQGLEEEKDEAERARDRWEGKRRQQTRQEHHLHREARDRLAGEMAGLQKDIRQAARELKKEQSREGIEQARRALAAAHGRLADPPSSVKGTIETASPNGTEKTPTGGTKTAGGIGEGDRVWLEDMDLWGTVLALSESSSQLELQVGGARLTMHLEDVDLSRVERAPALAPSPAPAQRVLKGMSPSPELDIRGRRANEVAPELDSYLNDASLAGLGRVRIIHGHGTGVVRQIVRDMLASHPLVKSFQPGERSEGGDGATMVEF